MEFYLLGILVSIVLQIIDYFISEKTEKTKKYLTTDILYWVSMGLLFLILSLISWFGVILSLYSIYLQITRIIEERHNAAN